VLHLKFKTETGESATVLLKEEEEIYFIKSTLNFHGDMIRKLTVTDASPVTWTAEQKFHSSCRIGISIVSNEVDCDNKSEAEFYLKVIEENLEVFTDTRDAYKDLTLFMPAYKYLREVVNFIFSSRTSEEIQNLKDTYPTTREQLFDMYNNGRTLRPAELARLEELEAKESFTEDEIKELEKLREKRDFSLTYDQRSAIYNLITAMDTWIDNPESTNIEDYISSDDQEERQKQLDAIEKASEKATSENVEKYNAKLEKYEILVNKTEDKLDLAEEQLSEWL